MRGMFIPWYILLLTLKPEGSSCMNVEAPTTLEAMLGPPGVKVGLIKLAYRAFVVIGVIVTLVGVDEFGGRGAVLFCKFICPLLFKFGKFNLISRISETCC